MRERLHIDPAHVRSLYSYNPDTGLLTNTYKECTGNRREGEEPGFLDRLGYRQTKMKGVNYLVHRIIWAIYYQEDPPDYLDHINGIPDDNRIINLREVTCSLNQKNAKLRSDNTSGFTGVEYRKSTGEYVFSYSIAGRRVYSYGYLSASEASQARLKEVSQAGYHENHGRAV